MIFPSVIDEKNAADTPRGDVGMAQTNILLESGTNELELVEFYIDEENHEGGEPYRGFYGVNVAKVLEIIRMPAVTRMPGRSNPAVLGTFNLRSKVIPLVDLSRWLKKTIKASGDAKVIVSEFNRTISAFMVSGVTRIHRISWQEVEPPDAHITSFSNDSVTGVVRFEDRILLILDMEKVLGDLNPSLAMRLNPEEMRRERPAKECLKALIADDSASIRRMIAGMLEKAGFQVTRTTTGKEAWDTLEQIKAQAARDGKALFDYVDIVVSDIEMPVMDGHNLTKRIKDDPVLKELPVILFSSLITDRLRHKGESVGADDQVSKPDITTLTNRAYELIEARQGPLGLGKKAC